MSSSILIGFGFLWMAVAALIGLYLGAKHDLHLAALNTSAVLGDLLDYHARFDEYKWRTTMHAHGMLFSLSAIVAGIAMPTTAWGESGRTILVALFMGATVLWTLAAAKRIRALMGVGDLAFLAAIAAMAWGVLARP